MRNVAAITKPPQIVHFADLEGTVVQVHGRVTGALLERI
jgi:hypothetical protein